MSATSRLDDLPTIGRNFSALAIIAPGATASTATGTGQGTGVSISGQRPFTNGIVVDGASNQMQFYGRQANDFPQDWIQEFQVLTNAFTAEYGQAAGGVLNVITRSGANKLNGRGYGFFRDANFDSPPFAGRYDANVNPVFLDETPPFDQQRYGGFVGGPLRTNRLFFFGGLERAAARFVGGARHFGLLAAVRDRHDHSHRAARDRWHREGGPQRE